MQSKRSQKACYLDLMKGIQPDYLLQYSYGPNPYSKRPLLSMFCTPGFLTSFRNPQGGMDIWGINYVATRETNYAVLPQPGNFILKDIRKWRDVVKAPDISHFDWEKIARDDMNKLASMGIRPSETVMAYTLHTGYFQLLMALMGFVEGLCAIQEEPEEVIALMDYVCGFYEEVSRRSIDYYKPDMLQLTDDTAAYAAPFISPQQYRDIFKPLHARDAKFAIDRGLPVGMHCCGNCRMFIDDWMDFGVSYWDPAQECNDLVALQKKYGNRLIITGGCDIMGELVSPDCSEKAFKDAMVERMDKYTKEALFVFCGWIFGAPDNEGFNNKNRWLTEICEDYGATIYR